MNDLDLMDSYRNPSQETISQDSSNQHPDLTQMDAYRQIDSSKVQNSNIDPHQQKLENVRKLLIQSGLNPVMAHLAARANELIDPGYWKDTASDIKTQLTNFPDIQANGKISPDTINAITKQTIPMALAALTTTPMSAATRVGLLKSDEASSPLQTLLDKTGEMGYSVPRTIINSNPLTNLGERFGGKQAIEQTTQIKNQPITNEAASQALADLPIGKSLGITKDTPVTEALLNTVNKEAGKSYDAVRNVGTVTPGEDYLQGLDKIASKYTSAGQSFPRAAKNDVQDLVDGLKVKSFDSGSAIDMISILRENAKKAFRQGDGGLGLANRDAANLLENTIGKHLQKFEEMPGDLPDVVSNFQSARKTLAITHSIEDALNPVSGNILANQLGNQLSKGVPLSGKLKDIAEFSLGFGGKFSKEPPYSPMSGGLFEPMVYGTAGHLATGNPGGAAAAAIPILGKPIARSMMTVVPKPTGLLSTDPMAGFKLQKLLQGLGLMSYENQDGR